MRPYGEKRFSVHGCSMRFGPGQTEFRCWWSNYSVKANMRRKRASLRHGVERSSDYETKKGK